MVFYVINFVMIMFMFGLAFLNVLQENIHSENYLPLILFSVLAPILATALVPVLQQKSARLKLVKKGALFITITGLMIYSYYVLKGHSNPNTAGHMHIILFPISYGIYSLAVMALCGFFERILADSSAK